MANTVFITGGSSGIGLELAKHYVSRGDNVILLARNQAKLDEAVLACKTLASAEQTIVGQSLDVADFAAIPNTMSILHQRYGSPDLVLLSAGVVESQHFLEMPAENFDWIMRVNLGGVREMTRAVLPMMQARGSGQIAVISSMAGLMGTYGYTAYCASKFALRGFVEALRYELQGSGISLSLVCPGEVATPMVESEAASILPQTRLMKDTIGTLSAAVAAKKIARGIARNKALIVPGFLPNLTSHFVRHCPGLSALFIRALLKLKFAER